MRTLTAALSPLTVGSVATLLRTAAVTVLAVLALSLADLALMPLVGTRGGPDQAGSHPHPTPYAEGAAVTHP